MKILLISLLLVLTSLTEILSQQHLFLTYKDNKIYNSDNNGFIDDKILISGLEIGKNYSLVSTDYKKCKKTDLKFIIKSYTYTISNDNYVFINKFGGFEIYDSKMELLAGFKSDLSVSNFVFPTMRTGYGVLQYFIKPNEVNKSNILYKSTNSGQNWVSCFDFNTLFPTLNNRIDYINFIDENNGFILLVQYENNLELGFDGYPKQNIELLKTNDGGKTWEKCIVFDKDKFYRTSGANGIVTNKIKAIYFTDEKTGFMKTEYLNKIFKTNNGGKTWCLHEINVVNKKKNELKVSNSFKVDSITYKPFIEIIVNKTNL